MAYGEIKVDTITFTDGGIDKSVSISGLVQNPTFSGSVTVTGTISGNTLQGQTISGVTVTGATAQFTSGTFISLTGTTTTGTTASFATGVFTSITGTTATITSGIFASGTAAAPSVSVGTTDNGLYAPGADQVAISTNGTGRLFVDASGRVGINTADPSTVGASAYRDLVIAGTGNRGITIQSSNSAANAIVFNDTNGGVQGAIAYSHQDDSLQFAANGNEHARITSDGKLGLGTSSPSGNLDVRGVSGTTIIRAAGADINGNADVEIFSTGTTGSSRLYFSDTAAQSGSIIYTHSTNSLSFTTNATTAVTIDSSQRVGIGTTTVSNLLHLRSDSSSNVDHLYIQNRNGGANSGARIAFSNGTVDYGDNRYAYIGAINTGASESGNHLVFATNANGASPSEKARITSSGQLLVGTSSSRSVAGVQWPQLTEGTTYTGAAFVTNANSGIGSYVVLAKSRGTAVGSNTVVQNGDTIGVVSFAAADGTDVATEAANIAAFVDGTPGANDMPGRLVFSTTADGASSPTARMTINNAGNVGINATPSTSYRLLAKTSSAIESALGTQGVTGDTTTQAILVTKFDNDTTTSQNFIQFQVNNGGANCGRITANGANTAAFGSTSDIRLKENIEDLPPQLEKILGLRPVEFDYIESEGGGHQIGFIAQEMQQIYPDVVNERGEDDMLMITGWSKTEARLVKALQEAVAKIETLEAKVAALEGV